MGFRERQAELLRAMAAADDRASDLFFTASSFDGSVLFHQGFPVASQIEVEVADVRALASRGFVQITEERTYGDIACILTDAGRAEAERLEHGGKSALEGEQERADRAERALSDHVAADEAAARDLIARREAKAWKWAWVPAVAVAILVSVVIYWLSSSGPLSAAVGILLALGVAGSWLVQPVRRWIAGELVRLLAFIHDRT